MKEHQDEAKEASTKHFTRAHRKASVSSQSKSAITDHVAATNHNIIWDESKILTKESHRSRRWIKELIHVIKERKHHERRYGQLQSAKDLPFPDMAAPTPWGPN